MSQPAVSVTALLHSALTWFQTDFRERIVFPVESQFPNFSLPAEIRDVLSKTEAILNVLKTAPAEGPAEGVTDRVVGILTARQSGLPGLLKQVILLYRRHRAAHTEALTEKTFHLEMTSALERDVKALDSMVTQDWFLRIEAPRLPKLKDYLPVQFIESSPGRQAALQPRQYDEKFHILQAPQLFLSDQAHFRAQCEDRDTSLAVAFLDIDNFKQFNTEHSETKIDRNLLPRFMQAIEAHVYHHGYAYRQGGDEYLILVPSLGRRLAIDYLDELRRGLSALKYPEIDGSTTVSIGLCVVGPECPLTDRELRERANRAKKFAKEGGKNCIATYREDRFVDEELAIVAKPAG